MKRILAIILLAALAVTAGCHSHGHDRHQAHAQRHHADYRSYQHHQPHYDRHHSNHNHGKHHDSHDRDRRH